MLKTQRFFTKKPPIPQVSTSPSLINPALRSVKPHINVRHMAQDSDAEDFLKKMDYHQKIQYAMTENLEFIKDPRVAYYRGIGFMSIGAGGFEEAAASFKKAAQINPSLKELSSLKLAELYESSGDQKAACKVLHETSSSLIKQLNKSPTHASSIISELLIAEDEKQPKARSVAL